MSRWEHYTDKDGEEWTFEDPASCVTVAAIPFHGDRSKHWGLVTFGEVDFDDLPDEAYYGFTSRKFWKVRDAKAFASHLVGVPL